MQLSDADRELLISGLQALNSSATDPKAKEAKDLLARLSSPNEPSEAEGSSGSQPKLLTRALTYGWFWLSAVGVMPLILIFLFKGIEDAFSGGDVFLYILGLCWAVSGEVMIKLVEVGADVMQRAGNPPKHLARQWHGLWFRGVLRQYERASTGVLFLFLSFSPLAVLILSYLLLTGHLTASDTARWWIAAAFLVLLAAARESVMSD
jgi:hypothetical protein